MVEPRTIRRSGDTMMLYFDNGAAVMFVPTTPNVWALSLDGGGTGPVDPEPGGEGFIQPFDPDAYDASDPFGASPGAIRNHFGSDYNGLPEGTPIRAISDGVVANVGYEGGNGNHLTVHAGVYGGREIYWAYIHLAELPALNPGDTVAKGQPGIALLGNTGSNSFGAHLHITMSSTEMAWAGSGGIFDPHHFIETGQFIDRNW